MGTEAIAYTRAECPPASDDPAEDALQGGSPFSRLMRRLRGRWFAPRASEPDGEPRRERSAGDPLRNHDVFVLGGPGVGKTVLLASMYKRLSIQRRGVGFFLAVSDSQKNLLLRKYRQIANPAKSWPAATRRSEVSSWDFACSVRAKGRVYPVFQFRYRDYAGEFLHASLEADEERIQLAEEAKKADAVLVLLDGEKVLRHMRGSDGPEADGGTGPDDLETELESLLPIVAQLDRKPVQFLLTKWDVIQSEFDFRKVRSALMEIEDFREIVEQRVAEDVRSPTRIIPVSALGRGFARLDESGRMLKTEGRRPRPMNVEMSIACTSLDRIELEQRALEAKKRRLEQRESTRRGRFRRLLGDRILRILRGLGNLPMPAEYWLGHRAITVVAELVNSGIKKSVDALERELETSLAAIADEEGALEAMVLAHQKLAARLDDKFPESDLRRL